MDFSSRIPMTGFGVAARKKVPHANATTVRVAAGVMAAVL